MFTSRDRNRMNIDDGPQSARQKKSRAQAPLNMPSGRSPQRSRGKVRHSLSPCPVPKGRDMCQPQPHYHDFACSLQSM